MSGLEVRPEDEEAVAAAAAEVGELEVGFFKAVLELLECSSSTTSSTRDGASLNNSPWPSTPSTCAPH